jgi:5'-nucleotidase
MPRILVTNDDGVRSDGLQAVVDALIPLGEVVVVAPQNETSAVGHALTLHRPLRLEGIRPGWYAVDGTPTDCVNVAVVHVLEGVPDLVVSGINLGLNLGDDVTYSGTVSGALEGALFGALAIAMSVAGRAGRWKFDAAARVAARLSAAVLTEGLPPRTLLNVNVPEGEPRGLRTTVQGNRQHSSFVARQNDPRGRPYYWIGLSDDHWIPDSRSDVQAIRDGFVSVTPLHSDMTAHGALDLAEKLSRLSTPGVK